MKKVFKLLSIIIIAFSMILSTPQINTQAATRNPLQKMPKTKKTIVNTQEYLEMQNGHYVNFCTPDYKKKVELKATSSNKKVATVKVYKYHEDNMYSAGYKINCKKSGKTTIKVTAKVNGKTYKKSCTYVFEKYKNPFTSFKIDGKNYASKMNKGGNPHVDKTLIQGKLSYKVNSNYKIIRIVAEQEDVGTYIVKNNNKLKANTLGFEIEYQNKKTKVKGTIGFNDDDIQFNYWYY